MQFPHISSHEKIKQDHFFRNLIHIQSNSGVVYMNLYKWFHTAKRFKKRINKVSLRISWINKQSSFIEILEKIVSPTYTNSSNDPYTFFHIILEYDPSDRLHLCKRNSCILGFAEEKNSANNSNTCCKNVHYFWPWKLHVEPDWSIPFKFCPKHVGITYKISPGIVPVPGFLCYFSWVLDLSVYIYINA